ncbi:MAG: xanthine dehydrogenase family protein subunit M [Xanthobacteraceae bacterium]|jgi:aerobic carbon-monoxide dehydrogenase medium subunit
MKPGPFIYHDPRTLPEALALLGDLDNVKVLAGGQSLMPMMNMRYAMPDHLVDLNLVEGLAGVTQEDGRLRIGSMTRQRDLEVSADVATAFPLLREALRHVGHRQTRNRGTIGGSLCHLDPAAELPAVCLAAGADLHVAGTGGERTVAMTDFPLGFMTPAIRPDEIVTSINLPSWPQDHGFAFEEFARRQGDFAIVGVAVLLAADAAGAIVRAAIALCGVADRPRRCPTAEALLIGEEASPRALAAAAAEAGKIDAASDIHASRAYRAHLATVLTERALARAVGRLGRMQ